jgi:hypothetical protein
LRFLDPRRPPTIDEAHFALPIEYALRSSEENDVIFVGDSGCHEGIDPARFKRLTGLTSYNLGSQGGLGPVGTLATAKAYLEHHPLPRVVVLCVTPFRFEISTASAGGHVAVRFAANYGPEVAGVIPIQESIAYFVKRGANGFVTGPARDTRDLPLLGLPQETYRSLQRKDLATRGFFALPGEHGGRWNVEQPPPPQLILAEWDEAVRKLAKACDAARIAFVIRFAPIWDQVASARDFAPLERWAQEVESAYPRTRVARPIILAYEKRVMWDALHLNAVGIDKFAPVMAIEVRAALPQHPGSTAAR